LLAQRSWCLTRSIYLLKILCFIDHFEKIIHYFFFLLTTFSVANYPFTYWKFSVLLIILRGLFVISFFLLTTFSVANYLEMIKLSFVNKNAPLSHCRKCSFLFFFYRYPKEIKSFSKHNIVLLYWSLSLRVLCQWLR
jgi:hypothetical protein